MSSYLQRRDATTYDGSASAASSPEPLEQLVERDASTALPRAREPPSAASDSRSP